MKNIREIDFKSQKVILRCDFNVTIKDNTILDDEKIISSIETINYLINKEAKVIIMSHLGKIKDEKDKEKQSLYIVYERLSTLLKCPTYFSSATKGPILESKINALKDGEVLLMENTRYEDFPNEKESKCDMELSKYWASLGNVFINDAFGISHRKHASNYGISKYLETTIGFLMEKEIKNLDLIINSQKPFTIIMGGSKIEDKLDFIKNLLPKCDYLLLGGAIANSFINVNYNIGQSLSNKEKQSELQELLKEYPNKIILPTDVKVLNNGNVLDRELNKIENDDIIYDIGPKTLINYQKYIKKSSTIFLNGTVGKYELPSFELGTKTILEIIANSNAISVIGGGDALTSANHFNINNFTYISTGGGATLNYLSTNKLTCFDDKL